MWFAFGLVSLTVLIAYRIDRKSHGSWRWENDHGDLKADGRSVKPSLNNYPWIERRVKVRTW